jgi:hypothetical protein
MLHQLGIEYRGRLFIGELCSILLPLRRLNRRRRRVLRWRFRDETQEVAAFAGHRDDPALAVRARLIRYLELRERRSADLPHSQATGDPGWRQVETRPLGVPGGITSG